MVDSTIQSLLRSHQGLWLGHEDSYGQYASRAAVATGFAALDAALPANGWEVGTLTELLVGQSGIGELSLLLPMLRGITSHAHDPGWAALINPPYTPYAPALANAGIKLERLLVVRQVSDADALWAAEQLLRTGTFSAVSYWVSGVTGKQQRRLQLAAEAGQCIAVSYRLASQATQHSPAALRLTLAPQQNHLLVDIIKARGGACRQIAIRLQDFDQPQGVLWPLSGDST